MVINEPVVPHGDLASMLVSWLFNGADTNVLNWNFNFVTSKNLQALASWISCVLGKAKTLGKELQTDVNVRHVVRHCI